MADTNFVIVEIMSRGNLDGTSTEFHVDNDVISDNRNLSVDKGVLGEFAVQMLMQRVLQSNAAKKQQMIERTL